MDIERVREIAEGIDNNKTLEELKVTDIEIMCMAYDSLYAKEEEENEQKRNTN